MKNIYLSFLLLAIGILSCSKSTFEDQNNQNDGRNYVVVEEGKNWTYQYDTIAYSGTERDTFSGFLKYEIGSPFLNNAGDTSYNFFVYWKRSDTTSFVLSRVETIRFEKDRYVVSQDGLNFIKLAFPLIEGNTWLGHSLFDTSVDITEFVGNEVVTTIDKDFDWKYRITDKDIPLTVGDFEFEKTLIVNQVFDTTRVSERIVNEIFAENIGLVSKNMIILNRPNGSSLPIKEDADIGYLMELTLIEYD
jgi:hypothetical protein